MAFHIRSVNTSHKIHAKLAKLVESGSIQIFAIIAILLRKSVPLVPSLIVIPHDTFFPTLHWFSSLSCINDYLAIDSDGYVYEQPSRIKWLDASQRS